VDACLDSTLAVSPSSPSVGQLLTLTFTVNNPGSGTAQSVNPSLQINSGDFLLSSINGPVPSGPLDLGPGISQIFSWTGTVTGVGTVEFTATATGTDSGTKAEIIGSASALLGAELPANLVASMTANPSPAAVGGTATVVLTAVNSGGVDLINVIPSLEINAGASLVLYKSGPVPSGLSTLPVGGSQAFAWTYAATGEGSVYFTGTVTGIDSNTGSTLTASVQGIALISTTAGGGIGSGVPGGASLGPSVAASIAAASEGKPIVYPNPVSGDQLAIAFPLNADADKVNVDIYNSAYERVVSGAWLNVTQAEGTVVINGVQQWAPGVYFVRVRAKLVGGQVQEFKTMKIVVKR